VADVDKIGKVCYGLGFHFQHIILANTCGYFISGVFTHDESETIFVG
jgi:hypothetical protein